MVLEADLEILDMGQAADLLDEYLAILNKDFKIEGYDIDVRTHEYHTFYPTENLMKLLSLTDNKLFARPLPFSSMFIPVAIDIGGNITFNGIFAYHHARPLERLTPSAIEMYEPYMDLTQDLVMIDTLISETVGEKKLPRIIFTHVFDKLGNKTSAFTDWKYNTPKKAIKSFELSADNVFMWFFNIIDFLNHPDVVYKSHQIPKEQQEKRFQRGKPSIPPRLIVNVTGKTQRYLDAVKERGSHLSPSHAFWVRGHFRHLTSDYYKDKKGAAIWVAPFIKGDKLLIEKVYEMGKGDNENPL